MHGAEPERTNPVQAQCCAEKTGQGSTQHEVAVSAHLGVGIFTYVNICLRT